VSKELFRLKFDPYSDVIIIVTCATISFKYVWQQCFNVINLGFLPLYQMHFWFWCDLQYV